MEIAKSILDLLLPKQVTVFSKTYCPFSKETIRLLEYMHLKPKPKIYEVDKMPFSAVQIEDMHKISKIDTFPKIFVEKQIIGGFTDFAASMQNGTFDKMLEQAGIEKNVLAPGEKLEEKDWD